MAREKRRLDESNRDPRWWLGYRQHKGKVWREEKAQEMAARGVDEAEIAKRLRVSVRTVREYIGAPTPREEKQRRQQERQRTLF